MKKLAAKLMKEEIELPKWTRKILYEHLIEFCEDLKQHNNFKNRY
ncbi:MAG: hypothetical protein ACFE9Z_01740 [Promethearchaeota archaeon]